MNDSKDKELLLKDKIKVQFIKGDVKERKNKALLIFRYKYLEGL
ncbi:hypothetical protein NRK67_00230 [Fusobacteria bacterium ZRK30]|nr:hypothetical protein NRK67_00230 [Fusobacteria bacterium ZRK30]